jgi:hypothetical protein
MEVHMVMTPFPDATKRAVIIRDHLVPMIEAASDREGMNGSPLMFMAEGFMIGYRKVAPGTRMDIWRQRPLMRIEWSDAEVRVLSFAPGDWERAIMALREV